MIKHITRLNVLLIVLLLFSAISKEILSVNEGVDSNNSNQGLFSNDGINPQGIENLNTPLNNTITYTIYDDYNPSLSSFLEAGEEIESIALGVNFSAALTTFGRLFTWGLNANGQLGDGTILDRFSPVNITSQFTLVADEKITSISLGDSHSAALTSKGRLFTWGLNSDGQLGNDTIIQSNSPVEITSRFELNASDKIIQVELGSLHSIAITSTGRIYSWGSNASGQLGNGGTTLSRIPVEITSGFTLTLDDKINFLSTGESFSSVITTSGRVFTWGLNSEGQLGNGFQTLSRIPVEITSRFGLSGSEKVTLITLGATHVSALTSAGKVFTWGSNYDGELGDGTTSRRLAPTNITSRFGLGDGENITALSLGSFHSSALTSNGRVFTWGFAGDGQLGEGTLTNRNTPMDITFRFNLLTDEKVSGIALGSRHSSVKTSTGRIFTWGSNVNGQLGNGTTRNRLIPENVTIEFGLIEQEKVDHISLGENHSAALTSTGRLFTWGFNGDGKLGQGLVFPTIRNSIVPVDITEKFNLSLNEKITQVSLGSFHSAALTSTGRVFTWGDNGSGQLGNAAFTSTESTLPIDITARFNLAQDDRITFISLGEWNSSAISLNGQVFTWGNNNSGQLGNQFTTLSNVPINITSQFSFSESEKLISISIGFNHMIALTSTGRVFTWGNNNNGQIGDATLTRKTVPTNITSQFSLGLNETITKISAGENHSAALSSTGKVFTWGLNNNGQLGDTTLTQKTVPTNITSQFTLTPNEQLISVSLGHNHSSAITSTGRVFTWGQNSAGHLGDNSVTNKNAPSEITSRFNLIDNETITAMYLGGEHSSAITSAGKVFTWGWNRDGQLGFSFNMVDVFKPRRISSITTSTHVSGSLVQKPTDPVKTGFLFNGWYTDETFRDIFDFTTPLNSDIELFGEFITQEVLVIKVINAITPTADLTLLDEDDVKAARVLYDALTLEQRALVTNYNDLLADEARLAALLAEIDAVIAAINTITPTADLTVEDEDDVKAVRVLYNALTEEQQALVTNYQILLDDEAKLVRLFEEIEAIKALTKTITYTIYDDYDPSLSSFLEDGEEIDSISLGNRFSAALTTFGRLFTWGLNANGQLGDGTIIDRYRPVDITSQFNLDTDEKISSLSLGENHSAVLTSKGRLFTWGLNAEGQLGNDTFTESHTPVEITSLFNLPSGQSITKISLGSSYSGALTSTGRIFTWGLNEEGQLGNDSFINSNKPIEITSRIKIASNDAITELSLGGRVSTALTSKGRVFTWGFNGNGQLGNATKTLSKIPIEITSRFGLSGSEKVNSISSSTIHNSALTSAGKVFTWGFNTDGRLGDGTFTERTTPTNITAQFGLASGETITTIYLGRFHSSALSSTGRLFTWGFNGEGQLGDGDLANLNKPTDITSRFNLPTGETITGVSLGWNHGAIKTSMGYIFAWGTNTHGQLGDGTTWNRMIPINTTFEFDLIPLEKIVQISLGENHSAALTSTGRLLTWGFNGNGKLGHGLAFPSPLFSTVTPFDMTDTFNLALNEKIIQFSFGNFHSTALTSTGRVFTWGHNGFGQLGVSSVGESTLPIDITSRFNLTSGDRITFLTSSRANSAVFTLNGQVFTWGDNTSGQLGNGSTGSFSSSPVNITSRFAFTGNEKLTSIVLGDNHMIALTSTKRIFSWGLNTNGQLGDGTNNLKNVPTIIPPRFSLTSGETITKISAGENHSAVLTSKGRVLAWGLNTNGQVGDDAINNRNTPREITDEFNLTSGELITSITLGHNHSSALSSKGRVFTWGLNTSAQLGDESVIQKKIPTDITSKFNLTENDFITEIILGGFNSAALSSTGQVFAWGLNTRYQLGFPFETEVFKPVSISNITTSTHATGSLVVKPADPVKAGFVFNGWYIDKNFSEIFDFTTPLNSDIELFGEFITSEDLVKRAINAITPTADIELSDKDAIEAARAAYEALSTTQKVLITNLADLVLDEARLAVLLAEINAVIAAINAITPTADLTVLDEDDVKAARALYDALTEEQQALVTNYAILVADEEKLVILFDEIDDTIALINTITLTANIALSDKDDIEAARASYEALSTTQKALVTNLPDLVLDEAALAVLLAEINAVIIAINAITPTADLTVLDEDDVKAARVLYDALTEEQQALVTNYAILVADEEKLETLFAEINAVIASINAITPTADIELSDKDAIEAARAAYEALSATQKALITNLADLVLDEARLAVLLAEINAVIIAINAITPTADLTVLDEDDVKAARVLYDALTEEQQALVTNYAILVADEEKLETLFADINAVIASINAITPIADLTLADKDDIEAARAAYEALSATQKALITNLPDLVLDEAALAVLLAEINAVIIAINAITPTADLTVLDEDDVKAARVLYDALTLEQRALVTNYQILLDDEEKLVILFDEIDDTLALINAITLTADIALADKDDIEAARAAYNALSETQKALVTNIADLVADEARLAVLLADINAVIAAINAITPTVDLTVLDEDDVKAARVLYDALTEEQQALVTNYAILVADEEKLATLFAETNAVIAAINAITPTADLTLADKADVEAARALYDALSATQKELITNYQILVDDEAKIAQLLAAQVIATIGHINDIEPIETLTLDDEDVVVFARESYNNLLPSQQALVTNYQTLLDAEAKIIDLKTPRFIVYYVLFNRVESEVVKQGEKLQSGLVAPTRRGFTFDGWVIEGQETIIDLDTFVVNEQIQLVAKFSRNPLDNESELVVNIGGLESINLNVIPGTGTSLEFLVDEVLKPDADQDDLNSIDTFVDNDPIYNFDQMFILDISIEVTYIDENGDIVTENISEPENPIEITIRIPSIYLAYASYQVVRVHNGVPQFLDTTLDPSGLSLSFESDKFSTYGILFSNTLVDDLMALINALSQPITLLDEAMIQSIRTKYDALTQAQKDMITNYPKLTSAEDVLDGLYEEIIKTIALINAITNLNALTVLDSDDIKEARASYHALSTLQQARVTNYLDLVADETRLEALFKEIQDVIDLINAIEPYETLSLFDENDIVSARTSYDALSESQKALVTNYQILLDDEAKLFMLKKVNEVKQQMDALPDDVDVIKSDEAEIKAARASYESLSELEKTFIPEETLTHLIEAENALKAIVGEPLPWFWILPFHILSGLIILVLYRAKIKKGGY